MSAQCSLTQPNTSRPFLQEVCCRHQRERLEICPQAFHTHQGISLCASPFFKYSESVSSRGGKKVYHPQHDCSDAANTVGDTTRALSSVCVNIPNSENVNRESNISSTHPSLGAANERRCTRLIPKLPLGQQLPSAYAARLSVFLFRTLCSPEYSGGQYLLEGGASYRD